MKAAVLREVGKPLQIETVQISKPGPREVLIRTKCIDEATKIWWDVRPHPKFPTLEIRISDICTRIDEAVCLTAVIQAIVAKLIKLRRSNVSWRRYPRHLITENKWRAVRHGIDGRLIDFGKREEVPLRQLSEELLEIVDDVVDELGSRAEIEYLNTILANGTSADRQLAVYRETGDLRTVIEHLVAETREGARPSPTRFVGTNDVIDRPQKNRYSRPAVTVSGRSCSIRRPLPRTRQPSSGPSRPTRKSTSGPSSCSSRAATS